jgi:hypothetical protein
MHKRFLSVIGTAILFPGLFVSSANAQVKISEFLAHNVWTNAEMVDYDDFSDWIELHNEGTAAADIGGYTLTGSLKNPKKSTIPTGTTIPAGGYLLFWADKHADKKKNYHANFKLDKEGEQLGLFDASGKVVDSITYSPQLMDVSMGRNPTDGSWAYFDQPTPGAANSTPAKKMAVRSGTVTFSTNAGFSSTAPSVTLMSADNSPIYYTTDGSVPNPSSTKYSGPISASTPIRARTITTDKIAGVVATNTYIMESTRKLMVIEMTTDQKFLDDPTIGIFKVYRKYRKIPVVFECFDTDGKPAVKFNGGIEVGSLTNQTCPQKPLQVALTARYGDEFVNYPFFVTKPITKFNRLRLRQGGDAWNTNWIADDLLDPISTGQMAYGWQGYRPVVVYINGKYYGLMDLREQFKAEFFKETYAVDTTGIQEVRRLLINNKEDWDIVHGSKSSWDKVVSGATSYSTAKQAIDINSMIDYYVIESFTCNVSWGHNEDMWWVPNGKWRWLTTDIDRCFDYKGEYSDINTDVIHTKPGGLSDAFIEQSEIFAALMKLSEFKNDFAQRYAAHLNSTLKASRLNNFIDSLVNLLTPEMTSQTSKWGSQGSIKSVSAWQTEINTVKKFCTERGAVEWKNLAKDLTGGTAKLTITVTNGSAGDIYIAGVRMCEGTSGLTFFKGAPLGIKAVPKKGSKVKTLGSGTADSMTITLSADQTITAAFEGTPESSNTLAKTMLDSPDRIFTSDRSVSLCVNVASPIGDHLTISLYNLLGRKIATLKEMNFNPGMHSIVLPVSYSTGVYFYRVKTDRIDRMQKINIR